VLAPGVAAVEAHGGEVLDIVIGPAVGIARPHQAVVVAGVVPGNRDVAAGLVHAEPGEELRGGAGVVVDAHARAPRGAAVAGRNDINVRVVDRKSTRLNSS